MPQVQKPAIKRAVENLASFGDTDVFPFPFENWFLKEDPATVCDAIEYIDAEFWSIIESEPPQFESTLSPAGYTGFRWVTSIDPFWNAYFLALVISLGPKIEAARVPITEKRVFSYRYSDEKPGHVFRSDLGWSSFMARALELSQSHKYAVATDISEFYRRINHHRLENALQHIDDSEKPKRIIEILSRFSQNSSYGLPIGGPAARLLSEITINQIDKLLLMKNVEFVRFSDDYYIFTNSMNDSYAALQALSQALIVNQGLTLQKSKTRIMTSHEFQQSYPKHLTVNPPETDSVLEADTIKLLRLSISYDPYSPNAKEDYEALQDELGAIDVVGLLTAEAQKSQINLAVSRRIVSVIQHIASALKSQAISTLLDNKEQFYPIMSNVLQMIAEVSRSSTQEERDEISALLRASIVSSTHVFRIDLHLAYAVRILAESGSEEDMLLISKIYENAPPFLRRDIILSYAKAGYWYPLSELRSKYSGMTPWEQRAFYLSSYTLTDEGKHWRDGLKAPSSIEKGFRAWCAKQKTNTKVTIRL